MVVKMERWVGIFHNEWGCKKYGFMITVNSIISALKKWQNLFSIIVQTLKVDQQRIYYNHDWCSCKEFDCYAALLPRRGPHIASHSVCLSVRPVIVTERHVTPPSELQWHTCTFRHAPRAAYRTAISAAQILVWSTAGQNTDLYLAMVSLTTYRVPIANTATTRLWHTSKLSEKLTQDIQPVTLYFSNNTHFSHLSDLIICWLSVPENSADAECTVSQ